MKLETYLSALRKCEREIYAYEGMLIKRYAQNVLEQAFTNPLETEDMENNQWRKERLATRIEHRLLSLYARKDKQIDSLVRRLCTLTDGGLEND